MPGAYSIDLRVRVVEAVEAGASRREAAERFEISASTAIRWMERREQTGSAAAKPTGGSCSPLEKHADRLLALIAEQPDLTLEEVVAAMGRQGIDGSRTAVWRFFERHNISFKKNAVRRRANPRRCGPRAPTLDPATAPVGFDGAGVSR
jgi:transposase